jgi:hypothetical protein
VAPPLGTIIDMPSSGSARAAGAGSISSRRPAVPPRSSWRTSSDQNGSQRRNCRRNRPPEAQGRPSAPYLRAVPLGRSVVIGWGRTGVPPGQRRGTALSARPLSSRPRVAPSSLFRRRRTGLQQPGLASLPGRPAPPDRCLLPPRRPAELRRRSGCIPGLGDPGRTHSPRPVGHSKRKRPRMSMYQRDQANPSYQNCVMDNQVPFLFGYFLLRFDHISHGGLSDVKKNLLQA